MKNSMAAIIASAAAAPTATPAIAPELRLFESVACDEGSWLEVVVADAGRPAILVGVGVSMAVNRATEVDGDDACVVVEMALVDVGDGSG